MVKKKEYRVSPYNYITCRKQRAVYILHNLCDYTLKEVAFSLNISLSTVNRYMAKIKKNRP